MPKDATKNVDRYKIRGGQLNEFDFHQNQEELAEKQPARTTNLIPVMPREATKATKATKSTKVTKARKATKASKAAAPRGVSPKKLAARKAARRSRF